MKTVDNPNTLRLAPRPIALAVAMFVAGIIAGMHIGVRTSRSVTEVIGFGTRCDTVIVRDTIIVRQPVRIESRVVRRDTVFLKRTDDWIAGDSARVVVPVEQRVYESPDYRAWVSGYRVSLDSLWLMPQSSVVTRRLVSKPGRWIIGVTAGVGASRHGLDPYIGVGISYTLIRL